MEHIIVDNDMDNETGNPVPSLRGLLFLTEKMIFYMQYPIDRIMHTTVICIPVVVYRLNPNFLMAPLIHKEWRRDLKIYE